MSTLFGHVKGQGQQVRFNLEARRRYLAFVIATCRRCGTLSEAGRQRYAVSRQGKKSTNDAGRLRKYLARFKLSFEGLRRP